MKLHRNSLLTAAAIVLVLYVVSLIVGLPAWAAILLTVVLLVLLAVVWKQPEERRPVVTPTPPAAQSVVLPDREPVFSGPPSRTVADVRLPSASPDFQFSFSAVVQWSTVLSGARHADLGAVAVDALLERARALTATQQVTEESLNQHRLAAVLGEPALDEKGQVRSWATEVRLRLPDADQKHLDHLATLHRREQTTLLERRMEQDKRAYLKNDVSPRPVRLPSGGSSTTPAKSRQPSACSTPSPSSPPPPTTCPSGTWPRKRPSTASRPIQNSTSTPLSTTSSKDPARIHNLMTTRTSRCARHRRMTRSPVVIGNSSSPIESVGPAGCRVGRPHRVQLSSQRIVVLPL